MSDIDNFVFNTNLNRRAASVFTIALGLSGCGGGGNDSSAPSTFPKIIEQPAETTVSTGEDANFKTVVQSDSPVSYQWLRNGSPIQGAVNAELVLTKVNTEDSGSAFSVRVANSAGTVQSNSAKLHVQPLSRAGNIAIASGFLGSIDVDLTVVGLSSTGDFFIWERLTKKLTRATAEGTPIALLGTLQFISLIEPWKISILEHSSGDLYIAEALLTPSGHFNTDYGGGGRVHRVTLDGAHSIIYESSIGVGERPAGKLTPVGIAENSSGDVILLHFNSPALYRFSTLTPEKNFTHYADLIPSPIIQLAIVFRYSVSLALVSTISGNVFVSASNGYSRDLTTGKVKSYEAFDYEVKNDGTRSPVKFGHSYAHSLAAHGDYIYALIKDEAENMNLVRRSPEGTIETIAGGGGPTTISGPLPGSLGDWVKLIGVTPEGRVILGQPLPLDESGRYAKYFVVTPPAA